jgi:hypothetical protein
VTKPASITWPVALAGFRIHPELVGRRIPLGTHDGYRLRLPTDVDDSLITDHEWRPNARAQVTEAHGGKATVITVDEVHVRADFSTELDYLATVPADYSPTQNELSEVEQLRVQATTVAEGTIRAFIDLYQVLQKRFGAVVFEAPSVGLGRLLVGRPPNWVRFGGLRERVTVTTGTQGLSSYEARRIYSRLQSGKTIPLAWEQYLEAHRRLFFSDDPRPALVEAVTSVEVGLKDSLRRKGRGSKAVALLIRTDRLRDLLKEISEAVLGESYAVVDKVNYDRLIGLVEQRHALVHRAQAPNVSDLKIQVEAVRGLLEWLDSKVPW